MSTVKKKSAVPAQSAVEPTTLVRSARLNKRLGADIVFACETFQVTGSFKFRAAHSVASSVKEKHVITASSGNFGQALAYACGLFGKRCTVVMPSDSAQVKMDAVREFGGEVVLVDTARQSRADKVAQLMQQYPDAYCASAYDDSLVIEGNATLGRELSAISPGFDAILAPIGGGGLCAGIIKGFSQADRTPPPIFGVEPSMANDFARSLKAGYVIANDAEPKTIADGVRTVSVGKINWQYLQSGITDVLEVSEQSIIKAFQLLFLLANVKAEPTGAVSLAGVLENEGRFAGQRLCCVVSGGNVDKAVFEKLLSESLI
jgi:threonine dehydratase